MEKVITVEKIKIGGTNPLVVIAGPCVIENEPVCLEVAACLKALSSTIGIPVIFKASFDKANRSSVHSFRGPGIEQGLTILRKVKSEFSLPLLTDIHCREEVEHVASVVDVIQIPAFLCRQTDLLQTAAQTGKVINVKKGQFLAPWDMKNVIEKLERGGNTSILLTERGVSFGYNNLISDMRSIVIMRGLGYPVIFDATHSVQLPGGKDTCSSGERNFIEPLSLAAVACGCDGLFLEVHPEPEKALCDGPNSLPLAKLEGFLKRIKAISELVRSFPTENT